MAIEPGTIASKMHNIPATTGPVASILHNIPAITGVITAAAGARLSIIELISQVIRTGNVSPGKWES